LIFFVKCNIIQPLRAELRFEACNKIYEIW